MKLNTTAISLCLALCAASIALAKDNPFDPVFEIMTQERTDPNTGERTTGCRGCHLSADGPVEPYVYFGDTQDEVEYEIVHHEDGELVEGGRDSIIATYLRDGYMPFRGVPWNEQQLELLYLWLDSLKP